MFMTRGQLPFAPLWERYFRGHEQLYSIYIHAPPDYVPTLAPSSPFFGRFIPSKVHSVLLSVHTFVVIVFDVYEF